MNATTIYQSPPLTSDQLAALVSERVCHDMRAEQGLSLREVIDRALVGALGVAALALGVFAVVGPTLGLG